MERLRIRDMAEADRPREKLLQKGMSALSDAELLAILIGSGNDKETAVELSRRILHFVQNNLDELGKLDVKKLSSCFKGIGEVKAITIVAALELGRRRAASEVLVRQKITSSQDIYRYFYPRLGDLQHEEFWILLLSHSMHIIQGVKIGQGGLAETTADIKLIMHEAISSLASCLVLCHNHPSGNLQPSIQDDEMTQRVKKASLLLDLRLLDHVIVAHNSYYSYADEDKI